MSELKHTPGPWSLEFDDVPYDGGFETMVINSENGGICMMDCPKDDMDANGRLIAASPDLFEFIEKALPIITREAEQRQNWGERHNTEGHPYATEMRDLADEIEVLILKVKGEL
jgi:hypothetical protein